jgi:hypothetical protein
LRFDEIALRSNIQNPESPFMWHPSWRTANFLYELSTVLLLAGVLTTGIAVVGIWWMGPIRDAYLKVDAAQAATQAQERVNSGQFDQGKEKLARIMAEQRPRPKQLTDEQTAILSASLGDPIRQLLIIRAADAEAATFGKQLAAAFERAKIATRVGVIEREAAPSGLFLYEPDESRGAALMASFDRAQIDIVWERRLHPRFSSQPILLVGRTMRSMEERNLPADGQRPQ